MFVRVDELILLIEGALTILLGLLDVAQHPHAGTDDGNERDGREGNGKIKHVRLSLGEGDWW